MTEQDRRNIEAVRRFYQAEREVAADDLVWHVPGHNPVSGVYRGRSEYFDMLPSRMAPLTVWDIDVRDVMVNGEFVVATFRLKGERKGRTIDLKGAHVFRLNSTGQGAEGWGFTTQQDELDAFFSA